MPILLSIWRVCDEKGMSRQEVRCEGERKPEIVRRRRRNQRRRRKRGIKRAERWKTEKKEGRRMSGEEERSQASS